MTLVERFKLFVDAVAARFKAQEAEISKLRSAQGGGKKEYREMYIPRSDIKFPEGNGNNKWITIPFDVPFSERPMVNVVLDIQDQMARVFYVGNITTEGFDIGINYAPALKGVWYQAWIVDK
ncbi:hypothetical protein [Neisseria sp. HMSC064E01]|jgi:hypothetical protein|uniref:hypothetical protein n=1 Tax=Neisseria sp. HMSC064E01 TaxID=1715052 RepID=UPI0008A5720F|nr:hypothetical protein [Neisseria sp. HMSC064E01]OFN82890.1 hypothetical protein HMPREF2572_04120 [Neisseria sp. HMSC064E01]